jgi:hypothetical protein
MPGCFYLSKLRQVDIFNTTILPDEYFERNDLENIF